MSFLKNIIDALASFKVKLSTFLKFRLYGINNNTYFPKRFNVNHFNWNQKTLMSTAKNSDWDSSNNTVLAFFITQTATFSANTTTLYFTLVTKLRTLLNYCLNVYHTTLGDGFLYVRGLFIIFFVDALIADDEPIWEPVEWSLLQSWILFIFIFAWIGENLISSRYGSYTGRDKRVWMSWYKTFWLIEGFYALSLGAASLWVMTPHYFEITYGVSFIYSWWHWYSRVFFFKFISIFSIVIFVAYFLQISMRWNNWKKSFYLILIINFFLGYLLYTQFFISFFSYFTDPRWHAKTRLIDYVQLSHEPSRWGWGDIKRDHFTHHRSKTVFWYKNDGPFASTFMFYNFLILFTLFTMYFYWIALIRRVYVTQEITYTFTTYCISSLKQFFYFFFLLFITIFCSYMYVYWRMPNEFLWTINAVSWLDNFGEILLSYPTFLIKLFF